MGLAVIRSSITSKETSTADSDVRWTTLDTANLTAGTPYLIIVKAWVSQNSTQPMDNIFVKHGGTKFADSDVSPRTYSSGAAYGCLYKWWTIWTPSTAEGLSFWTNSWSGGNEIGVDQGHIIAIPLGHVSSGTDYHFTTETTPETIQTSWNAHAELTFTPATAGHDWLMLFLARMTTDTGNVGQDMMARGHWTVGVVADNPFERKETNNTYQIMHFGIPQVRNLAATSHTVSFQHAQENTGNGDGSCTYSSIIAIDLDACFEKHAFECNPGDDLTSISTTAFGTLGATCTMTPDTASEDVLVIGGWAFDCPSSGIEKLTRLQMDNTDLTSGATAAEYKYDRTDATTEESGMFDVGYATSVTAASHTFDMDISADGATGDADDTCILAISLVSPSSGISDLNVTVSEMVDGWVPLTWTANASQFYIHRSTTPSFTPNESTEIVNISAAATSFTDNSENSTSPPLPDVIYYYVITGETYTVLSNYKSQQMPPPRPTGLVVDWVSDQSAQVTVSGGTSTTRDIFDWWYTTPVSNDELYHMGEFSSNAAYRTQVYSSLSESTAYRFYVRAGSTETGYYSGWETVDQTTVATAVSAADTVDLSDVAGGLVTLHLSASDIVDLSDTGEDTTGILRVSALDSVKMSDSLTGTGGTHVGLSTDGFKVSDLATLVFPGEAPSGDTSGWDDKSGLAYPPNIVPELEPWMERVRVTLEHVIDEVQGAADVLYISAYMAETGNIHVNIKCNPDTVAIRYLLSTSTYPTATQTNLTGQIALVPVPGQSFQIGPLVPALSPGETGYITVVGYMSKTSSGIPSGDPSFPATDAVTYQTPAVQDLAPIFYWKTEETGTTGKIYLTPTDPNGDPMVVRFQTKIGFGTSWSAYDTRINVTSGSTIEDTVQLTTDRNSYIRFEIENVAGYTSGGEAVFDPDQIPDSLGVTLHIDASNQVTARWQGDTDTSYVKIASSKTAFPTAATVRAQGQLTGQFGTTGTLQTLQPGETCFVSAFAYSSTDRELASKVDVSFRLPNAGAIGANKEITFSDSAPGSPSVDDLWIKTNVTPYVLYRWDGATWKDIGLLDQGTFAKIDDINDSNVGTTMVLTSLSSITADVGVLTTGLIRNYDSTAGIHLSGTPSLPSFINLDADNTVIYGDNRDYLIKFPGLTVQSDGASGWDVDFSGTVSSELFTADSATFGSYSYGRVIIQPRVLSWGGGAVTVEGQEADRGLGIRGYGKTAITFPPAAGIDEGALFVSTKTSTPLFSALKQHDGTALDTYFRIYNTLYLSGEDAASQDNYLYGGFASDGILLQAYANGLPRLSGTAGGYIKFHTDSPYEVEVWNALRLGGGTAPANTYKALWADTTWLYLQSNRGVLIDIDSDNNATGELFRVRCDKATTLLEIVENGNVHIGSGVTTVSRTSNFMYIPTTDGAPTGVPSSSTGRVAMCFDTTNNRIYIYDGGWVYATTA